MSLATLRADLAALESAVSPWSTSGVLRALGPVEVDAADIIDLFSGDASQHAVMKADPDAKECIDCCDRIKTALAKVQAILPGPKVGAWGDGTFLKLILPIILDWITKWLKG